MSLIIGIRCADGIVIGADSSVAFGNLNLDTLQQPARKIHIVAHRAVMASAGSAGLAQQYKVVLERLLADETFCAQEPAELVDAIQQHFTRASVSTINSVVEAKKIFGNEALVAIGKTMVALPANGQLILVTFDEMNCPQIATEDMPHWSIGTQSIADPYLADLRDLLWNGEEPTLPLAIVTALWTLQHAIRTKRGDVCEPVRLYTLTLANSKELEIHELDNAEIDDHAAMIADIRKNFSDTVRTMLASRLDAPAIPNVGIP